MWHLVNWCVCKLHRSHWWHWCFFFGKCFTKPFFKWRRQTIQAINYTLPPIIMVFRGKMDVSPIWSFPFRVPIFHGSPWWETSGYWISQPSKADWWPWPWWTCLTHGVFFLTIPRSPIQPAYPPVTPTNRAMLCCSSQGRDNAACDNERGPFSTSEATS